MVQTACVDIRALPLQLLLRAHPEWKARPVVVVDRDKPQGIILWANHHARACRILPGLRYAAGLALSRDLCGGVVGEAEIADAKEQLTQRLWAFSPRIEPAAETGVFWLDASGLRFLFPSLEAWAANICGDLRALQFAAVVAVGFSRFGSYAAARANRGNIVFGNAAEERAQVRLPVLDVGGHQFHHGDGFRVHGQPLPVCQPFSDYPLVCFLRFRGAVFAAVDIPFTGDGDNGLAGGLVQPKGGNAGFVGCLLHR